MRTPAKILPGQVIAVKPGGSGGKLAIGANEDPYASSLPIPRGAVRYLLRLFERHNGDRDAVLQALRHQAKAIPDDHRLSTLAGIVALDEPLPTSARRVSG